MHLPPYDHHFPKVLGSYQQDKFQAAMKWVRNWGVALDVGAHVGHWSHNLKGRFKTVHSFEPVPDNYNCLILNVPGINYYPFGLGQAEETVDLFMESGSNTGSWTTTGSSKRADKHLQISIKTIDSLGLEPDFIKMDIQNHELFALRGAYNTLVKYKPVLCLESNNNIYKKQIHDLLHGIGYDLKQTIGKEQIFV